jgi:hypothetical protein
MKSENTEVADSVLIRVIGKTLTKITLFICCTVIAGLTVNTCQVDEKIIIQCEESCGTTAGMKEVTGTTCTCNTSAVGSSEPWVIPRK